MGGRQRRGRCGARERRHSALSIGNRRRARVHASRPLSRRTGCADGGPAESAGGIPARRERRARHCSARDRSRPHMARSIGNRRLDAGLRNPDPSGPSGPRPRCSGCRGRNFSRNGRGGRQDFFARYRAQVGHRRSASRPDQPGRGPRSDVRHSRASARSHARCAHLRCDGPSHDRQAGSARIDRGPRGRRNLRAGGGIRPRRHCGRGHQRQGAGLAAARSGARSGSDQADQGIAYPEKLSRRPRGGRKGDSAGSCQACPARSRRARGSRDSI